MAPAFLTGGRRDGSQSVCRWARSSQVSPVVYLYFDGIVGGAGRRVVLRVETN